ncbi:segregation and condensation protein B [Natronospira proteinivora]|uniref:Segregation and condensation protein B n=2 Tax=Natronospira proteinivora TaxID=1807133 RepID=A0ABT1G6R7_9GAMM|nr:segregation and condensation protein B [Natronospira proteinivora]
MEEQQIKNIVEGALLASGRPLKLDELEALFKDDERPERNTLRAILQALESDYEGRALALRQVASGFRIEVRQEVAPWVSRLWEERPSRYSRALLETLALIAYRQPVTRGEIEEVRGVSVSSSIIRTLQERGWIKVVGHRDVPGRPAMFGTTREFLDYFGLKSLDELPSLAEIRDIDSINVELELDPDDQDGSRKSTRGSAGEDGQDESGEEAASSAVEGGDGGDDANEVVESESPEGSEAEEEAPSDAPAQDAPMSDADGDTDAEGIVDDAEQGDSVDERHLGRQAEDSPFEESPFAGDNDDGEDLDFEEAYGEEEAQDSKEDSHEEAAGETQGSRSEVSETVEEERESEDGERRGD